MANSVSNHRQPIESWQNLQRLFEEIAALAESSASREQFHQQVLQRSLQAVNACAGAIWTRNAAGQLRLESQILIETTGLNQSQHVQVRHAQLVDEAMRTGEAQWKPAHSPLEQANPTALPLLLCPVVVDRDSKAILETFHRPDTDGGTLQQGLQVLGEIADLCRDFYRGEQLRHLHGRQQTWQSFNRLLLTIYGHLDVGKLSFALANEGRNFVGCDRMSVAVVRSGRCHMTAISGVDWLNRRSNAVQKLEELTSSVVMSGSPHVFGSPTADDRDAPLFEQWQSYADEHDCQAMSIFPLRASTACSPTTSDDEPPFGALIAEQFGGALGAETLEAQRALAPHAGAALHAAMQFDGVPLKGLWRWTAEFSAIQMLRRHPLASSIVLAAVLLVAALALVPADFVVEAQGELQPSRRRTVFASQDGEVAELLIPPGDQVERGQSVLTLRSYELEYEQQRIAGELQASLERLAAVDSLRLKGDDNTDSERGDKSWTAERAEIQERIASLNEQLAILKRQAEELALRSPISGQVLTWDAARRLASRPVKRGQALLTVADSSGPWRLELKVRDRRIGHVLRAQSESEQGLDVEFILASDPANQRSGVIEEIAASAHEKDDEAVYDVTVSVDRVAAEDARPGAAVIARIHCGKRALGYVWLFDAVEALQRRFWL